jgi:16S rRNA (guanine527-N7)-methyltransferase
MRPDFPTEALERAWGPARAAGVVGSAPLEEIREHTVGFVSAVCSFFAESSPIKGLDVGSGAGIPGLLIAWELPASSWTLLDASWRRCELATDAVVAMGLRGRVVVVHGRSGERLEEVPRGTMDVVTARLLGSASETLELCAPYCRPGGLLVVSIAERDHALWERAEAVSGIEAVEFSHRDGNSYVAVTIGDDLDKRLPRRAKARARQPLLTE